MYPRNVVCFRYVTVSTLHRGNNKDDDDDNNNNHHHHNKDITRIGVKSTSNAYRVLVGRPDGRRSFNRRSCRWQNSIRIDLKKRRKRRRIPDLFVSR